MFLRSEGISLFFVGLLERLLEPPPQEALHDDQFDHDFQLDGTGQDSSLQSFLWVLSPLHLPGTLHARDR